MRLDEIVGDVYVLYCPKRKKFVNFKWEARDDEPMRGTRWLVVYADEPSKKTTAPSHMDMNDILDDYKSRIGGEKYIVKQEKMIKRLERLISDNRYIADRKRYFSKQDKAREDYYKKQIRIAKKNIKQAPDRLAELDCIEIKRLTTRVE